MFLPQWAVHYIKRRPRLRAGLVSSDYATVLVGALDREGAEAAFLQRFPPSHSILSITLHSGTGAA